MIKAESWRPDGSAESSTAHGRGSRVNHYKIEGGDLASLWLGPIGEALPEVLGYEQGSRCVLVRSSLAPRRTILRLLGGGREEARDCAL